MEGGPADSAAVGRMCAALRHRGPDQQGQWETDGVALGATRLRILDLTSAGDQPMIRDSVALVYNGEVYNHGEIRSRLLARGIVFRSRTDTEVVLEAYRAWGLAMLQKLDGMFAFALWDKTNRQLVLARDRFGVKPLYYARHGNACGFASEIKALLAWTPFRQLDESALGEYLLFRDTAGERTLLRSVQRVLPGEIVVLTDHSERHTRYWEAGPPSEPSHHFEAAGPLLRRSVAAQLQSDVPVGTLCSGGIDSSLVTRSAKDLHQAPLHTFSVSFPGTDCDESDYASSVASRAGTIHHQLRADSEAFADQICRMTLQNDEPLKYENSVFVHQISQLARELGVIVLLTGEGADEIFGGYPPLIRAVRLARIRRVFTPLRGRSIAWSRVHLPVSIVSRLHALLADEDDLVMFSNAFSSSQQVQLLLGSSHVELPYRQTVLNKTRGWSLPDRVRAYDLATYLPPILMRQDKMSMAASVESRVPMLGNELAGWALSQPAQNFVSGSVGKLPLRRLALEKIPPVAVQRTKVGFRTPTAEWMRTSPRLKSMFDVLSDRDNRIGTYVDAALASRWLRDHRQGIADHSRILWTLLALELWLRGLND